MVEEDPKPNKKVPRPIQDEKPDVEPDIGPNPHWTRVPASEHPQPLDHTKDYIFFE